MLYGRFFILFFVLSSYVMAEGSEDMLKGEKIQSLLITAYQQAEKWESADFRTFKKELIYTVRQIDAKGFDKAQVDLQQQRQQQLGNRFFQAKNFDERQFNCVTQVVCNLLINKYGYSKKPWPQKGVEKK